MKIDYMIASLAFATALAAPQPVFAAKVVFTATLTGSNEPAGGDADGTGSFSAEIDANAGDFCYVYTADKIAKPTMMHVHSGATGTNGPPVITLELVSDVCIAVDPEVLKAIIANPANYYVNFHNAEFPAGALRGQLAAK